MFVHMPCLSLFCPFLSIHVFELVGCFVAEASVAKSGSCKEPDFACDRLGSKDETAGWEAWDRSKPKLVYSFEGKASQETRI